MGASMKKQSSNVNAEDRKTRWQEKQALISAQEEADNMMETKKIEDALAKKMKVLSLSRGRSAGKVDTTGQKSTDEMPTIKQINNDAKKDKKVEQRPQTAQVNSAQERAISQEKTRFEAKQKREAQLRIVELEEAKEFAAKQQKAKNKLQETEKFLEKKGMRSVSPRPI